MLQKVRHQRFLELLRPIEKTAQVYVKHLAWSRNDIEDIFQTALLNAFRKFDAYEEGTNFKAWFFQFITYAAFNANRKHEKISTHELLVESEDVEKLDHSNLNVPLDYKEPDHEKIVEDPDSVLANIEEEIRHAIRKLPVRRRSVFLLRAVADLSYIEISQVLNIPAGTVMGELYRARGQLRKDLDVYARRRGILKKEGDSNEM